MLISVHKDSFIQAAVLWGKRSVIGWITDVWENALASWFLTRAAPFGGSGEAQKKPLTVSRGALCHLVHKGILSARRSATTPET
jgi:hypothetical protein